MEDLEREYRAGDLDEDDYEVLHSDYTKRTALVLRRLEDRPKSTKKRRASEVDAPESPDTTQSRNRVLTLAGVSIFALLVGVFLARTLGERGVDEALTGTVDTSQRDQRFACRRLGEEGDFLRAMQCYDSVLEADPTNVDALVYRGWFRIQQVGALTEAGEVEAADGLLQRGKEDLDAAVEIGGEPPETYAFRAIANSQLGNSTEACADLDKLTIGQPAPFLLGLTNGLFELNDCGN